MSLRTVLIIDNYDSFTYTIKYYFDCLGVETVVVTNDDQRLCAIDSHFKPSHIVLSPGPGTPDDTGLTLMVIERYFRTYPILGICLGHQCIAQVFGGEVTHANQVMHGKLSKFYHHQQGIFQGIPSPFIVTRYHSLIVRSHQVMRDLKITGWTRNSVGERDEIMAIAHQDYPVFGIQFHPEAVLTQYGKWLLDNFLQIFSIPKLDLQSTLGIENDRGAALSA